MDDPCNFSCILNYEPGILLILHPLSSNSLALQLGSTPQPAPPGRLAGARRPSRQHRGRLPQLNTKHGQCQRAAHPGQSLAEARLVH